MFTIGEYIISVLFYGFPWFTFSLVISSNEYLLFSLKSFGTLISSYLIIQIFCIPFIFLIKENFKIIINVKLKIKDNKIINNRKTRK